MKSVQICQLWRVLMQKPSVEFLNTGVALYSVLLPGHQAGICVVSVLVLVEACPVCEVTIKGIILYAG